MSFPSALKGNPKCIFFTDFDGTITLQDVNDYMVAHLGFGDDKRRELGKETLEGRLTFRETFQMMLDSIKAPFPECVKLVVNKIKLDPAFEEFHQWARKSGVPVVILSSGLEPIIRELFKQLLGSDADDLPIIANEVVDKPGKTKDQEDGWDIKFHDDSGFGHDKSLTIRPYRDHFDKNPNEPRPTMFYAGDGISDLSAARETDLLFAKRGMDLVTYCEREGLPFTLFDDWSDILKITKEIYDGKKSLKKVAAEGVEEAKDEVGKEERTEK